MANEVFANGLEIACKAADGKSVACFPDPCWTPGWSIVPYANTAYAKDTANASKTVFISGKPVMKKDVSYFKTSTGNEPAAGRKGQFTGVKKGKAYFNSWSMDVKVEGKNVDRHTDYTTHNHGSWVGNTSLWHYLDTKNKVPKECIRDCTKVLTACAGVSKAEAKANCKGKELSKKEKRKAKNQKSRKKFAPRKSKEAQFKGNWKNNKCNTLMSLKPYSPCMSLDKLKKFEDKFKNLNVEKILKDKIQEMGGEVSTSIFGGLAQSGRGGAGAGLGDMFRLGFEAYGEQEITKSENYQSGVKLAKSGIWGKVGKFKDRFKKINSNFDKEEAAKLVADVQQTNSLLDPCLKAKKCQLEAYNDTSKYKASSQTGCCKGQTGHHLFPKSVFNKGTCPDYDGKEAPTVCAEGTGQKMGGSHQAIHDAYTEAMEGFQKEEKEFLTYKEYKKMVIDTYDDVFMTSNCSRQCMEKQLDDAHPCGGKDMNKVRFPTEQLNSGNAGMQDAPDCDN